jgi:hypothetical protein
MSVFLEKLTKSRQTVVEAGGKNFTILRPTPMQAMDWLIGMGGDPLSPEQVKRFIDEKFSLNNKEWRALAQTAVERFVVDWPGMTELDIIPGGIGASIPFDKELFLCWVEDHPGIITTLGYRVFGAWIDYLNAEKVSEKKPETGSGPDN